MDRGPNRDELYVGKIRYTLEYDHLIFNRLTAADADRQRHKVG